MADKIPVTQYGTPAPQYSPPVTVTAATGRPGYDFDPYDTPGERAEGFFIGKLFGGILAKIGKVLGIATLDDPCGFLSTYREWHISLAGAWAGLRAGTFADIPECPPLWTDEIQYYRGFAAAANVLKCQWPTVAVVLLGLGANAAGVIPV
jgi:hypothetical protein